MSEETEFEGEHLPSPWVWGEVDDMIHAFLDGHPGVAVTAVDGRIVCHGCAPPFAVVRAMMARADRVFGGAQ